MAYSEVPFVMACLYSLYQLLFLFGLQKYQLHGLFVAEEETFRKELRLQKHKRTYQDHTEKLTSYLAHFL
jgi:hypothetical protein